VNQRDWKIRLKDEDDGNGRKKWKVTNHWISEKHPLRELVEFIKAKKEKERKKENRREITRTDRSRMI